MTIVNLIVSPAAVIAGVLFGLFTTVTLAGTTVAVGRRLKLLVSKW